MTDLTAISVTAADGSETSLAQYRNQVMLIVNVASECGFTPQYEGLEVLQKRYAGQGFTVLGFPCNQFGAQEPGDSAEIANFGKLTYAVDFPLFAKIDVNGANAAPLYRELKKRVPGVLGTEAIKWNFTKFLVSRDGKTIKRFAPLVKPEQIAPEIEAMLAA